MNRPPLVNAFFQGRPLTGKMGEAVKAYIVTLENQGLPIIPVDPFMDDLSAEFFAKNRMKKKRMKNA